ncbi:right-handed parallel beta-helix repeat-containing protein [Fibrella forsythiae]|uniref:Right-handed parallel beta-helix repeat-containing protein n=1 Tax=Fibrella forsythiae TaxID=2817061 RepID=A0ABS3JI82_9BACT|nr:right-handed parallel beta-helix repeat-containing protein [Fibrella forsythiae]MBO0949719.1 right-handed parallel beta-helix repeat-containing protein [Fibrella forsythiae]
MKSIQIMFASAIGLAVALTNCKQVEVDPDNYIRQTATDTLTLAQVRAFNRADVPANVYLTDAGKQGLFVLDRGDRTTEDNTGLVIVTSTGRRFKRQFTGAAIASWFGIVPGDDDIGPELQLAIKSTTGDLFIPDGQYTQQTDVRMRSNLGLRANPGKVTITLPKSYVSLFGPIDSGPNFDNVTIDGINWVVTATATEATYGVISIDGPSVNNLTIQNCRSSDAAAKASVNFLTLKIQAGKTAKNVIIQQNDIQAKRMAFELFNHDNYNVYAGQNITVTKNTIHECTFGISLSGPLDGLMVSENYIKNCSLYGVEIAGASKNVNILNNKFEGTFDKFIEGSNDGFGNGLVVGGLVIVGNQTVGTVTGGIQLFNAGTAQFNHNTLNMTGRLELLTTSSTGGVYESNVIISSATHAIICDNAPNNIFRDNTISNKPATENIATFRAYGEKATGVVVANNRFSKGTGGVYFDAVSGATYSVTANIDETGKSIQ